MGVWLEVMGPSPPGGPGGIPLPSLLSLFKNGEIEALGGDLTCCARAPPSPPMALLPTRSKTEADPRSQTAREPLESLISPRQKDRRPGPVMGPERGAWGQAGHWGRLPASLISTAGAETQPPPAVPYPPVT